MSCLGFMDEVWWMGARTTCLEAGTRATCSEAWTFNENGDSELFRGRDKEAAGMMIFCLTVGGWLKRVPFLLTEKCQSIGVEPC